MAKSATGIPDVDFYSRAVCDRLVFEGHQVEFLDLPPIGDDERAIKNLATFRLLDTASSAGAVLCLDAVAATLPHPRKMIWMLDDAHLASYDGECLKSRRSDRAFIANVLSAAVRESIALFAPSRFAAEMLARLNLGKAIKFAPPRSMARLHCTHNPGADLLLLSPLTNGHRPELLVAALAVLPERIHARWVTPFAEPSCLARTRVLIAEQGVEHRIRIDARPIHCGEEPHLLAQWAALLDLSRSSLILPQGVSAAIHNCLPVVTCTDGGATIEVASHCAEPTAGALARAILAVCNDCASAPQRPEFNPPLPDDWSPLLKAFAQ